jgi:predicted RNA-binding protein YlxR (DUF448 family)
MAPQTEADTRRTCIVTRKVQEPAAMIRFVLGPDGEVVPDLKHKLPGRGVWVTAHSRALETAVKQKRFAKAFKRSCRADADLPLRTAALLRREALGLLALANKAGLVVCGFEKVAAAIASGKVRILIEAADGAEAGRRRLRRGTPPGSAVVGVFTSAELDLALGRTNVVHAAVTRGGLAERLLGAARRVASYEKTDFESTGPLLSE